MNVKLKQNLKKLLHDKDMTAAQLSRATSIAPQTLNNWLSGQEPRGLIQLKKVADYFGLTIDELAFGPISKIPNKYDERSIPEIINAGKFEVILKKIN